MKTQQNTEASATADKIAHTSEWKIVREQTVGVDARDVRDSWKHHAVNVRTSEIIYTGTFDDCVRAIHHRAAIDKAEGK